MNQDIDMLRDQIVAAIEDLYDKNDIINSLPTPEYKSYFILIEKIITKLEEDKTEWQEMLKNATTDEEKDEYQKEINTLNFKLEICHQRLDIANKEKQLETESLVTTSKHLIFSTSPNNNIYFEDDIKSILFEYYDKIQSCLERLMDFQVDFNPTQAKKFTNNCKLNGILEIKEFKIRVFYRFLTRDTIYILMARTKKSTYSKSDSIEVINRSRNTNAEYEYLREKMQNPEFYAQLIAENEQIYASIKNELESKKRGSK